MNNRLKDLIEELELDHAKKDDSETLGDNEKADRRRDNKRGSHIFGNVTRIDHQAP